MKYGNYKSKKSKFRILRSPLTLVVILVIFVALSKATSSIHQKAILSETKLTQAQAEYDKLFNREKDLQVEVNNLSTQEGIEAELRSKYRAVKGDESIAVILDDTKSGEPATTTAPVVPETWFMKVWQWISGYSLVAK